MRLSKRRAHLRKSGFKKGCVSPKKGQTVAFPTLADNKFVRLEQKAFDSRVHTSNNVLTFKDTDGTDTTVSPLRPRPNASNVVDEYSGCDDESIHPDLFTNKLMVQAKVQALFNSAFKEHRHDKPNCEGDLNFDAAHAIKWGAGWRERLKCTKCSYVSAYHKLYEEVENKKGPGRRAAKVNIGLQLGLCTTPISNTGLQRIFNNANIIAPNLTSMQRLSNKVNEKIQSVNIRDMREQRVTLVKENAMIGQKNAQTVNVEGDSCYNNPMFNSDSTPFQAGSIATTTFCENNTKDKKIIGVHIANKLCTIGARLRNKGNDVVCPNHSGHCSANVSESDPIGNEGRWSEIVARNISNEVQVTGYTGDGDSRSHAGVSKASKHTILHFKDIRHLGNSLKRAVYAANFSSNMFKGSSNTNLKNRFALSIKQRCVAELKMAHKSYNGDINKIKQCMPKVADAIVACFGGYCGEPCKASSLVCCGNYRQAKNYMPMNVKLRMTEGDKVLLLKCMDIMLSPTALDKTKLLTSTQKCEAVNRSYQTVNPKMITNPRNFAGRIHGQVHKLNNGYAVSVLIKTKSLGANLTKGSSVIRQIRTTDAISKKPNKDVIQRRKITRYAARQRRYHLHERLHYNKGLTDTVHVMEGFGQLRDNNYV